MALKVKAVERLLKFDKESAGKYRYVLKTENENQNGGENTNQGGSSTEGDGTDIPPVINP